MQRHIAKAVSISAIATLALTGCVYEFVEADGNCAEFTTGTYPGLYIDEVDGSSDSFDIYFDVETDGAYEEVIAYVSLPNPAALPYVDESLPEGQRDLFDSLTDEAFLTDRHNLEIAVSGSNPHRIDVEGMTEALIVGLGFPIGVVATCDADGYAAQLGPSPSASPSEYRLSELENASAKEFYPGYDPELADSSLTASGNLEIDFNDDIDVETANIFVVPFIEAFGEVGSTDLETNWYSALFGLETSSYVGDFGDIFTTLMEPGDKVSVSLPNANSELFSGWVNDVYAPTFDEQAVLTGAVIMISTIEQLDDNSMRLRYSFQVAGFNPDGSLGAPNQEAGIDYNGPQYDDDQLRGKPGEQVTIVGTNMKVNSATIGGKSARIISNTSTSLTLEIPADLEGGRYDVHYTFSGGEVTRQLGATVIDHSVWTKRLTDTQAKLYAKNVAGAGKVQFVLNGKEVAWVDAVDASDPKLRKANGDHYLVRTVNLKGGKNVLEIYVDGTRERRTVYTR